MEKLDKRTREIRFYSEKNKAMCSVHSVGARNYTKWLEEREDVRGYEANVAWDTAFLGRVDRVDIRGSYLTTDWTSDFRLFFTDGHIGIREMVREEKLQERAVIEKLELSRRYWKAQGIKDWKVVLEG